MRDEVEDRRDEGRAEAKSRTDHAASTEGGSQLPGVEQVVDQGDDPLAHGLLGLAMHLEIYWLAGVVAAIFVFGVWYGRRASRRRGRTDTSL